MGSALYPPFLLTMSHGTLYIVATPIGNLGDITLRALETLRSVDAIYAEDTRVTGVLAARFSLGKPLFSYRESAPRAVVEKAIADILRRLWDGQNLAYVSDAGTPGLSDPGSYLVQRVVEQGEAVVPIPGVSALSTLVSISGLPVYRPLFVGFLPKKKGHQTLMKKLRESIVNETADALIFYESPERIVKLLEELMEWGIPMRACLGRELSKMHEELLRGSLQELYTDLSSRTQIRGEICMLIANQPV